ncbi:MAG: TVP38/TMEM64 family protein [Alphaproteobacteria bacterium]|nr:TVP38/TMEM64 family protein [Alphaproteobacteria bacterium]
MVPPAPRDRDGADAPATKAPAGGLRRLWPLLVLGAAVLVAYLLGLHRHLSAEALAANHARLAAWVASYPLLAPFLYLGVYALAVALSLPGGVFLTLGAGLLFGTWLGGAIAVAGATIGAVLVFLAARYALAETLARKAGGALDRIRLGLERDGFSYLLVLRLVPAFPFWLVNLAPALVGMRLAPYAAATAIGIVPATFIFAGIGAGLGEVLAAGGRPDTSIIFSAQVLGPLLGLAALALLPVALRRFRARRDRGGN